MSVVAMAWAWEQNLEPAPKIILLSIADVADDEGIAYCSNQELAARCNLSDRSVITHIHALTQEGFLIQQHREGKVSVFIIPLKSPLQDFHPSAFDQFWAAYPKKVGRKPCETKWKSKKLDALANRILKDISLRKQRDRQWIAGYVPNPLTYLNQERWEDELQEVVTRDAGGIARKWREQRERIIEGDVLDATGRLTHH